MEQLKDLCYNQPTMNKEWSIKWWLNKANLLKVLNKLEGEDIMFTATHKDNNIKIYLNWEITAHLKADAIWNRELWTREVRQIKNLYIKPKKSFLTNLLWKH